MMNLNDLADFVVVVQNGGFSAAERNCGVEKTRLSRRIAALEAQLGVKLLKRSTRNISLTEAGERFFVHASVAVEGANAALQSMADLRAAPMGTVRLSCPQVLAQTYLAPILPQYLAACPSVRLELDTSESLGDPVKDRYDVSLRAHVKIEDSANFVAREFGEAQRILVASPALLDKVGRVRHPNDLSSMAVLSRLSDIHDGFTRWTLRDDAGDEAVVKFLPRLATDDLRVQLEAAIHGVGVALLPEPIVAEAVRSGVLEIVLPKWAATSHVIHMIYLPPRGILPSVRSLIDYLSERLPGSIQARSVDSGFAGRSHSD